MLAYNACALGIAMASLWLVSLPLRNASIVDIFWGPAFVIVGWVSFYLSPHPSLLPVVLVTLWGTRLGVYLAWRNVGKGEDARYAAMRKGIGAKFWWVSFLTVFVLQGVLALFVSLPVQLAQHAEPVSGLLQGVRWVGLGVFAVGLGFEAIGDLQLARFKANPENRGKVLKTGLWRYTRHPNYFGDFLVWWGLFLVSLNEAPIAWSFASPLVMSVLLMRVSGVTLLERTIEDRRPEYAHYKQSTPAFFPWFPKSGG